MIVDPEKIIRFRGVTYRLSISVTSGYMVVYRLNLKPLKYNERSIIRLVGEREHAQEWQRVMVVYYSLLYSKSDSPHRVRVQDPYNDLSLPIDLFKVVGDQLDAMLEEIRRQEETE